MHFMTEVNRLRKQYGFSRKVAVLITRIKRGVDSLDILVALSVVSISDHYRIQQFFADTLTKPQNKVK